MVMGQRVMSRRQRRGSTHGARLLVAMAAVAIGAAVGGAMPSAACRRLAALMELDEQAEQERLAAELRAERDKAAAAQKAAEAQGVDPKTERINKYIASKFVAWLEVHGEAEARRSMCDRALSVLKIWKVPPIDLD